MVIGLDRPVLNAGSPPVTNEINRLEYAVLEEEVDECGPLVWQCLSETAFPRLAIEGTGANTRHLAGSLTVLDGLINCCSKLRHTAIVGCCGRHAGSCPGQRPAGLLECGPQLRLCARRGFADNFIKQFFILGRLVSVKCRGRYLFRLIDAAPPEKSPHVIADEGSQCGQRMIGEVVAHLAGQADQDASSRQQGPSAVSVRITSLT